MEVGSKKRKLEADSTNVTYLFQFIFPLALLSPFIINFLFQQQADALILKELGIANPKGNAISNTEAIELLLRRLEELAAKQNQTLSVVLHHQIRNFIFSPDGKNPFSFFQIFFET